MSPDQPGLLRFTTAGGVDVRRNTIELDVPGAIEPIVDALDSHQGVLLASSYEYPGRYSRWDIGFVDPPLEVVAREGDVRVTARNERGEILLETLLPVLQALDALDSVEADGRNIRGVVAPSTRVFTEEERSRRPSTFSVLRAIRDHFFAEEDTHLGLYGAFGYDLAFQFQPVDYVLPRPDDHRDLVLYLPDRLTVVDHSRRQALCFEYDFTVAGRATDDLPRTGPSTPYEGREEVSRRRDHEPGGYAALVDEAKLSFARGDLFEVVPGQTFYEPCPVAPSELFRRLRERNPSPYGSLINLGEGEYLVGASPEMYVRVDGRRVESCPISGTIERGVDVMGDADAILELLNSTKDASELTMCTDVDRNDKSRVCEPGSVRVIGRRQIEMYSRLIHTVDHVEGMLRPEFDALDAFLTHTWAVTVTGAPKLWAMRFIEGHERSCRAWYGGALGVIGFDGNLNTGLTLRTIRVKHGVAEVRAGATLLMDSDPQLEEAETELKASAFLDAIRRPRDQPLAVAPGEPVVRREPVARVLLVDHEDSFVHTLANYLAQAGAEVRTVRAGLGDDDLRGLLHDFDPQLVLLSPGPGRPADFGMASTIDVALDAGVAVFGVCLGLQGIVERFGGTLGQLGDPMHGKPSEVTVLDGGGRVLAGLPESFTAGRYHSLFADEATLPPVLRITARADDGVIMAVEHETLPIAAVQFHPESIMTMKSEVGLALMRNVLERLAVPAPARARPDHA